MGAGDPPKGAAHKSAGDSLRVESPSVSFPTAPCPFTSALHDSAARRARSCAIARAASDLASSKSVSSSATTSEGSVPSEADLTRAYAWASTRARADEAATTAESIPDDVSVHLPESLPGGIFAASLMGTIKVDMLVDSGEELHSQQRDLHRAAAFAWQSGIDMQGISWES
eukprot:scaffold295063_cov31-Tisochrysis_lutea.AAC.2